MNEICYHILFGLIFLINIIKTNYCSLLHLNRLSKYVKVTKSKNYLIILATEFIFPKCLPQK